MKRRLLIICFIFLTLVKAAPAHAGDVNNSASASSNFAVSGSTIFPKRVLGRELLGGKEYIRLNLGELYVITDSKDPDKSSRNYVVRGIVYKNADLAKNHECGLVRIVIVCCAADALAVGIRFPDANTARLDTGKWIKIYGHLQKRASPSNEQYNNINLSSQQVYITDSRLANEWYLAPDRIESLSEPTDPYIMKWSEKEPYNY